MPRAIPENERIDYFIDNFINPILGHLLGLGLALKKDKCYKAFRNYRTVLARSGALTNPLWFHNPNDVQLVREYLENNLRADLACSPKDVEKTTIRISIGNYGLSLARNLYELSWRTVDGDYIARYTEYQMIQELDSYFNVHASLTFFYD